MLIFARSFMGEVLEHQREGALVVGLYGDLGSGKTTFVQCVAKEFGITEHITSPTFLIQKTYKIPNNSHFKKLVHIDTYRLEKKEEMESIGWNKIVKNKDSIILIEWAEKIKELLPKDSLKISFDVVSSEVREVKINGK